MSGEQSDTIFALSSGSPPAAIAIIRISGPRADAALQQLAGRVPEPRKAELATFRDETGGVLDRGLMLRFPRPASATGEDVAELHLHGGRAVVAGVLEALGRLPCLRQAKAGEFTRRAFENGRIDLAEAEGLADLLEAETESQRRAALMLAGGALRRLIKGWQEQLLVLAAEVEAILDFGDEGDVEPSLSSDWHKNLQALRNEMEEKLARPSAERLREGVKVVLSGPVNAGKSSLFNAIVEREAAIVSPRPGTTRDVIEAPIALSGMPFLFVDTAGLRESDDAIEGIGVERARTTLNSADLVIWLGSAETVPRDQRVIVVASKADLSDYDSAGADLSVSAKTGEGMGELLAAIMGRAKSLLPVEGEVSLNSRHRTQVKDALNALGEAENADPLLAAEGLRAARNALDAVTGKASVENLLDALFGRFCIGK